MDRIIVKNFGPLKDIDIELNRINLFIGENGSGKSVLGKIITIILYVINFDDKNLFFRKLVEFNINFIKDNTLIKLYKKQEIVFKLNKNTIEIDYIFLKINSLYFNILKSAEDYSNKINKDEDLINTIEKGKEILNKSYPRYIPAERNLISIFNQSIYTFLTADIPIPKFLISFFSEFEKARNSIKELDFLNIKYIYTDKIEIYYSDNEYLELEKSSSGIQSALPLYLTVKYFANKHQNIIIEEPEQNLFPKAQKETVEYIIEQLGEENSLFMMTHSPYILTALNNLILANDVKNQKGIEAIKGIVKEKQCVAFEDVSAYSLIDGKAIDIMDREDRIIGVNVIDSISDEVNNIFDELLAKLD
ncbi:MAG: ATP-binding protein [Epsilonproteobacteria bacterium]|nr:ATP-binding protein [Campylobacterota bacterium]